MRSEIIRGRVLGYNAVLNLIGQGIPLVVGVITIPLIIRGLGAERFGILSLVWVVLGYFSILDLGLGRATIKFVAEALGRGQEDRIHSLVWTAAMVQGIMGLLGSSILFGITPLLVEHVLRIPSNLMGEAKVTFYALSLAIPIVLVSGSFAGVLQAAQRFDLLNAVRIPSSVLNYVLPLASPFFGVGLPFIVALILLTRLVTLAAIVVLDTRIFPQMRDFAVSLALFPSLFSYGGWVMVSGILSPILVYLDRLIIASLISIVAVTYYTAPYEAVIRVLIIPSSLTMSLFPAFSTLQGLGDRERLGRLLARSIKYELLLMAPIILILVLFAKEILQLWLGGDFSRQSTTVFQLLAIGVLINSLAYIPYALLQGVGRPDLTAKFQLLELLLYVGTVWFFIRQWGISGAAAVWTMRMTFDAFLMFLGAFKICHFSPRLLANNGLTISALAVSLLLIVAYVLRVIAASLPLVTQFVLLLALFGLFFGTLWMFALDNSDRGTLLRIIRLQHESNCK
jgi:O-antigen/teichoic acid export membrane protein